MSDKNYNNDPIERFFREKANEYDIQYREEDWLKLEERLDKTDQLRANRRRRRLAAAAVTLLFAVLAFFTYQQQVEINQLNDQLSSSSENVTNLPDNLADLFPDEASTDDSERNQEELNAEETTTDEQDAAESITPSEEEPASVSDESEEERTSEQDNRIEIQRITQADFKEGNLVGSIAKTSPGFGGRPPAFSATNPLKVETPSPNNEEQSGGQTQRTTSTPDRTAGMHTQQNIPRFTVGLQMGPDISTVSSISDFAKPGHKIGFSLEYNITDKLAITTGAQHTKVRYVGSGNEYRLPDGYLPYGAALGEMEGVCLLIDIPVSLKYDLLHFHSSRVFASAGVSSYIMLDEDYKFTYEENESELTQRWHKQTGTRHWMSNGTLSIGYELDLRQNISVRAEPFLKVPLKEVGWGNVDLYSIGSFFSIHYKW